MSRGGEGETVPDHHPAHARVVRAADAPVTALRYDRGSMVRLVDPSIGATAVDLHLNTIRAGTPPGPYHLHRTVENVYYALSGRVQIRLDGEDHELEPGDAVFIPPGILHSATNIGDDDAVLLEIYAPADVDFVEAAETQEGS